ncbi:MAG: hypothetical protein L7U68_06830 [Flavobacteriaceae bacterium]|jgi:hypothetical protein|nr:hypothetical protein [Flavobacteriaceae bacterium]
MKTFLRIMAVLALGMMIFNATMIDWDMPTEGDSLVAIIGILASGSALLLIWILLLSLKINAKQKGKDF